MNQVSKSWVAEGWRLVLGVSVSCIVGLITGYSLSFLALFLLIYAIWMIFRFHELEGWLRDGGAKKIAPDTIGIASEIMQLVYRDKKFASRQVDRLRTSLTRFNDMAAELPDATIVLNQSLQIIWTNASADTLLGIHRRRDIGQRIDNLIRDPAFHAFLLQPSAADELEIQSPSAPHLSIALRLVQSGDSIILTGRDITQRVMVREMRKAFVADVSHELRTPLTVIQGHLEMLEDEQAIPANVKHPLNQVAVQADRMSDIVNDLLTLSRLESSVLKDGEGEHINVSALIKSVLAEVAHTEREAHQLHSQINADLALLGKQKEIYSACQNLVQNAIKYTPPGCLISVTWQRKDDGAALVVADNGDGISEHHLPRLSERFYRVDKGRSRESGGTGLGLAIVKYIAQRHGGQLNIRSEPGQGSEFELIFPGARIGSKKGNQERPNSLLGSLRRTTP